MMAFPPRRPRQGVRIIRPLRDFLETQAAGGFLLLLAAVAALVMANSPLKGSYHDLWDSRAGIEVAGHAFSMDLRHWVNDGLMTLFFFVVGLEIKRELSEGELKDRRRAALPVIAALGGMLVPALLFFAVNAGGPGAHAWGIPMATDIAMAIGVLALLGSRVQPSLKLFLLALAIIDDIGAIAVIAIFYSDGIDFIMLGTAVILVAAVALARRSGVRAVGVYVVLGTALWFFTHEAGVHATIAGVVLGLMAPTKPLTPLELVDATVLTDLSSPEAARQTARLAQDSVSVVEWLEHRLHPWTSYVVVPVFAFANAGITITGPALSDALSSRITLGVVLGLVVGKTVGITLAAWLAVRLRAATLPSDLRWGSILGAASLAGMGFTVSLFVSGLAFDGPADAALDAQAKLGILVATVIAGVIGCALLMRQSRSRDTRV